MFIIQAILVAKTEHVVYFMLAAWLETLEHGRGAASMPVEARRLPIRGLADVRRRLGLVREKLDRDAVSPADAEVLRVAAATFGIACETLREFSMATTLAGLGAAPLHAPRKPPYRGMSAALARSSASRLSGRSG